WHREIGEEGLALLDGEGDRPSRSRWARKPPSSVRVSRAIASTPPPDTIARPKMTPCVGRYARSRRASLPQLRGARVRGRLERDENETNNCGRPLRPCR